MSWYIFSLCAAVFLGLAELTQQHLLRNSKEVNERSSGVLTFFFQALLTIPFIFIFHLEEDVYLILRWSSIFWFLASTFIASIAMVYYLRSFKVTSISFSCIFISWSAVISTILGIIFFAEVVNISKLLGIMAVLVAIVVLNLRNLQLEKNHLYALYAGILFGVVVTIEKKLALGIHPILLIFWLCLFTAVFGFLINISGMLQLLKCLGSKDIGKIMLSGLFYFAFNYCTFSAYTHGGEVGPVDAINNCQVFLIILIEYFIFRQKIGVVRKLGSSALAGLGIYLLGI